MAAIPLSPSAIFIPKCSTILHAFRFAAFQHCAAAQKAAPNTIHLGYPLSKNDLVMLLVSCKGTRSVLSILRPYAPA
eukprot:IDg19975t1